jgi:pyrroline-5-carboxylate reductase
MDKLRVGIIGFGSMGSAMAERMKRFRYRFTPIKVLIFDKDAQKTAAAKDFDVAKDVKDLAQRVDAVILAVKPQDIGGVLAGIKGVKGYRLVISIAAGITTAYIEKALGDVKVVRAMPNLAARIGRGVTGLCAGGLADKGDLNFSKKLFRTLGRVLITEERMMNAVTAVSGSGPAYVCYFLERGLERRKFASEFRSAAEKAGFDKKAASLLVDAAFSGTTAFLKRTRASPAGVIRQVASKGGTTEAALAVLRSGGSLEAAVLAAKKRAEELCL